jgi:lipoprotein-anchoring transpeptidase ErfK/SrfK
MSRVSLYRALSFAAGIALGFASCTELPNDVGVRRHRSVATQTRWASHYPIFSSWNDDATAKGSSKILVNLTTQQAFFYRGKLLIGRTNISSGRRDFETPPGKYRVIQKDADHVSTQYGAYVARSGSVLVRDVDINKDPCPKGAHFVGASMPYFLRFTGGYGMHAGFVPRYRASHGCIRIPAQMAQHFFDAAEVGTHVEVIEPPIMVER